MIKAYLIAEEVSNGELEGTSYETTVEEYVLACLEDETLVFVKSYKFKDTDEAFISAFNRHYKGYLSNVELIR